MESTLHRAPQFFRLSPRTATPVPEYPQMVQEYDSISAMASPDLYAGFRATSLTFQPLTVSFIRSS